MKLLARIAEATPGREVFSEILDALARRIDCERAFLFSLRPRGGFSVLAARTRDEEDISRPGERMSHHAVRKMVATRDTVFVEDARRDRRYRAEEALEGKPTARSILVIPLAARGEVRGGIYADHRFAALEPPAEDDEAVCGLAALAALALEIRERPRRGREASRPAQEGSWAAAGAGGEPAGTGATDERTAAGSRDEPPVAGEARLARVLEGRGGRPELFQGLLSTNPDMQDLFETVRSLARSDLPVLIQGETGTGKSLLARAVHDASTRSARPFVTFHCGTAPESLVEGELLGHVRGAFTGAEADHEGVLVTADGGTLFLDEVGDMSEAVQRKLLRVLEDGQVRPLGAKAPVVVDVRLVCATTRSLERLAKEGSFRRDLYFRLKGVVLEIPPLRERPEDVLPLAERFLDLHAQREGKAPPRLAEDARLRLLRHPWPGNVRELENEMRRLVTLGAGTVDARALTGLLGARGGPGGAAQRGSSRGESLGEAVAEAEREAIALALRSSAGNKSRAAARLGITRKSLYRRMAKYGIRGG